MASAPKRKVGKPRRPQGLSESERVYRARAERLEMENELVRGEVVKRADVEKTWGQIWVEVLKIGLTPRQEKTLTKKIEELKKNSPILLGRLPSLHFRNV